MSKGHTTKIMNKVTFFIERKGQPIA